MNARIDEKKAEMNIREKEISPYPGIKSLSDAVNKLEKDYPQGGDIDHEEII